MSRSRLSIHELTPEHRDWNDYVDLIDGEGQRRWRSTRSSNRFPRHHVLARQEGDIVGFMVYVVWEIGPTTGHHCLLAESIVDSPHKPSSLWEPRRTRSR